MFEKESATTPSAPIRDFVTLWYGDFGGPLVHN